jgi:hypothetical protein
LNPRPLGYEQAGRHLSRPGPAQPSRDRPAQRLPASHRVSPGPARPGLSLLHLLLHRSRVLLASMFAAGQARPWPIDWPGGAATRRAAAPAARDRAAGALQGRPAGATRRPARNHAPGVRLSRPAPRPRRRRPRPVRHVRVPARRRRPARRRGDAVLRRGAGQRPRQPRPGHRRPPVSRGTRPDRHALLELHALLTRLPPCATRVTQRGSAATPGTAGCCTGCGLPPGTRPWPTPRPPASRCGPTGPGANLHDLRNHLAHSRLPDIDEGLVRRFTWARLDSVRATVERLLRSRP